MSRLPFTSHKSQVELVGYRSLARLLGQSEEERGKEWCKSLDRTSIDQHVSLSKVKAVWPARRVVGLDTLKFDDLYCAAQGSEWLDGSDRFLCPVGMDGWMDGWTDGRKDEWMNGWMRMAVLSSQCLNGRGEGRRCNCAAAALQGATWRSSDLASAEWSAKGTGWQGCPSSVTVWSFHCVSLLLVNLCDLSLVEHFIWSFYFVFLFVSQYLLCFSFPLSSPPCSHYVTTWRSLPFHTVFTFSSCLCSTITSHQIHTITHFKSALVLLFYIIIIIIM